MARNLLGLYELTGEGTYLDDALALLRGMSPHIAANPVAPALATAALQTVIDRHSERLAALTPGAASRPDPVKVVTSLDRLRVSPDEPAMIDVTLEIAEGYHINAHEPGQANLIGVNIQLVGAEGLAVQPEYPAGELYRNEIRIHKGTVTLTVRIEKTGAVSGEPKLAV